MLLWTFDVLNKHDTNAADGDNDDDDGNMD